MRAQGLGVTTGTTAVVAVIADSRLHIANVGDSNAVLSFADGSARTLTVEHKPSLPSECARIEAMDGDSLQLPDEMVLLAYRASLRCRVHLETSI